MVQAWLCGCFNLDKEPSNDLRPQISTGWSPPCYRSAAQCQHCHKSRSNMQYMINLLPIYSSATLNSQSLINAVRPSVDMVLPKVCNQGTLCIDLGAMLSQPDCAKAIGPCPDRSQGLYCWLTARRRRPLLCQHVLLPRGYFAKQISPDDALVRSSDATLAINVRRRCLMQSMEEDISINRRSTVKCRVSDAQRQVPAWVAPSLCLPHCCVQTTATTKTNSAIDYSIIHSSSTVTNYIHPSSLHHGRTSQHHRDHQIACESYARRWRHPNHCQATKQHKAESCHHLSHHHVRGSLVQGFSYNLAPGKRPQDAIRYDASNTVLTCTLRSIVRLPGEGGRSL